MKNKTAFKNMINKDVARKISAEILHVYPKFDAKNFEKVSKQFAQLEFRERAVAISTSLKSALPADYLEALDILTQVVKNKNLSGFSLWGFSEFISQYGLDHFDESLMAMYELTQEFTAEFAVRPYFVKDHKKVLAYFEKWASDSNVHVRRWVSEGSRPLLPWGQRLHIFKDNPELSVGLLHQLKYDDELYVRKSVANHLNDVAKFNPKLVITTIKQWEATCPPKHFEKMKWIKRHGLRTLIKKGHPDALKLMGASPKAAVKIKRLSIVKTNLKLNDQLNFSATLASASKQKQQIIIDYVLYFQKSNGTTAGKIFKLKTLELAPQDTVTILKSHPLRRITTMKYYSGDHYLTVKVNGLESNKIKWTFNLTK